MVDQYPEVYTEDHLRYWNHFDHPFVAVSGDGTVTSLLLRGSAMKPTRTTPMYDVVLDEQKIGFVSLNYNERHKEVRIHNIRLGEDYQRRGFGKQIHLEVPKLPLPDGGYFSEQGFQHISGVINEASVGVWEALVREGLAVKQEKVPQNLGRYVMLSVELRTEQIS